MNRYNSTFKAKPPAKLTFAEALAKQLAKHKAKVEKPVSGANKRRYGLSQKPRKPLGYSGRLKRTRMKSKLDRKLVAWSKQVRERDDYTCQVTGIRDVENNVAHHVAPRGRRPDLRYSLENGITVTPDTHQWIHDNPIEATAAGLLSDATYEKARKAA